MLGHLPVLAAINDKLLEIRRLRFGERRQVGAVLCFAYERRGEERFVISTHPETLVVEPVGRVDWGVDVITLELLPGIF